MILRAFHLEVLMRCVIEGTYHPEKPEPAIQQAIYDLSQVGLVKSFDNNKIGQITNKGKSHAQKLLSMAID